MASATVELQNMTMDPAAVELQKTMDPAAVLKSLEFDSIEILKSMDSAAVEPHKPKGSASVSATATKLPALLAGEYRRKPINMGLKTGPSYSTSFSSGSYTDSDYSWYSGDQIIRSIDLDLKLISTESADDISKQIRAACGHRYSDSLEIAMRRKLSLDETFKKLGIEIWSSKTIQRETWSMIELKIPRWIYAAKYVFRVLFPEEIRDPFFMEDITDFATHLFNFVHAISTSSRSPEKLFKILEIHQVLSDLLPDIGIIRSKSVQFLEGKSVQLLSSLGDAVRETLAEFEKAVFGEPIKVPVPGGSVHQLTRYVMRYLRLMADYKKQLEELIVSNPSTHDSSIDMDYDFSDPVLQRAPTLERHVIWIIVSLKYNLEGKSKAYDDTALAHFFMMNNVHHIAQKFMWCLTPTLGNSYRLKLQSEYRMAKANYRKITWDRVSNCVKVNDQQKSRITISVPGVVKYGIRKRLKAFNAKFKEVLTAQADWVVPDFELQEELSNSIIEVLVPVYTSFLEKYRKHTDSRGKHPELYIKYSPQDVEKAIRNLFENFSNGLF